MAKGQRRKKRSNGECELELAVLCVLFPGRVLSLRQIEAVTGLSRERIRQIEAKALRKVRDRVRLRFREEAEDFFQN